MPDWYVLQPQPGATDQADRYDQLETAVGRAVIESDANGSLIVVGREPDGGPYLVGYGKHLPVCTVLGVAKCGQWMPLGGGR